MERIITPLEVGIIASQGWQKFAILLPKNIRACLAKQDQAVSYMWVTDKL